ncbi:MAG: hypothetical protein GY906_01580 [bacterium]|nr:hypothetical protein [bacterium]
MALFIKTPFRTMFPEPYLDPMSKKMTQDPPYRVYRPRSEEELFEKYRSKDIGLVEVPESHAREVLRKQPGYQEIQVKKFDARLVGVNKAKGPRRTSVAKNKKAPAKTPAKKRVRKAPAKKAAATSDE